MSLGSNVRRLREENKMTQEKLAEKVGVSFQAVSSWERDEYKPDVDKLIKLSEIFDVTLSDLIDDEKAEFETREVFFNWEHMKTFIKTTARNNDMVNTDNGDRGHQGTQV